MEPEEKKSNGALIGSVIIVLILIIGGIYIWQSKVKTVLDNNEATQEVTTEDTSDLDTLDQDLENLDTELNVDIEGLN